MDILDDPVLLKFMAVGYHFPVGYAIINSTKHYGRGRHGATTHLSILYAGAGSGEEQCPHCGRELAGRNPSGSLPAGTVLAGRYTVGDIQSVDGEGILYRGVENNGPFRVTIKEHMP